MNRPLIAVATVAALALAPAASASRPDPRRVRLEPLARAAFLGALESASERLAAPGCAAILDAFEDASGEKLSRRLAALGMQPRQYLAQVVFAEGHGERLCRRSDVLAFTSPGSRVVRVCGDRFRDMAQRQPGQAEAVVIHEMLHTLGLAEGPPSPGEITARVRKACAL